jgi:hypothetical protein
MQKQQVSALPIISYALHPYLLFFTLKGRFKDFDTILKEKHA